MTSGKNAVKPSLRFKSEYVMAREFAKQFVGNDAKAIPYGEYRIKIYNDRELFPGLQPMSIRLRVSPGVWDYYGGLYEPLAISKSSRIVCASSQLEAAERRIADLAWTISA